ncbi:hypothetical protein HCU74_13440 [Spongiibacter sp. KMU-166]|uniref:H-NS histone family protein n=1 Tax=Spongiibacter thalassae TaxID=2721624 RepID=A0ABX1GGU1_9GAMM|nr:hypothetical protein [Spongiibacter thalassae]NKI18415.1 hypothetical protein [Spongiibacter thalassae]
MDISTLQKQLQEEHKALDQKFKFISDLQALMKKHGQTTEGLLEILNSAPSEEKAKPAKRGRKPAAAAKPAAKAVAKKPRKKQAARPLRKFKNPNTGEIAETRAPQVDKTIKAWASELKVDWRKLEI